jgi:hypothetical protein
MPKATKSTPKPAVLYTVADLTAMSPAARDRCLAAVIDHCKQALAVLPATVALSREQRRTSTGRVGDDELPELEAILDVMDTSPALFAALAARDGGEDPERVETAPTRQAIAVLRALAPVMVAVKELDDALSDTRLRLGEQVREVTTAARAIAKANAAVHDPARAGLAKVEALRVARVKPPTKKPKNG